MRILSYNLSPQLKDYLVKIDSLNQKILTLPIFFRDELRLRWEAMLERTFWSLSLAQLQVTKSYVSATLHNPPAKPNAIQKDILNYKAALDYIKYTWTASERKITPITFKNLYDLACYPTLGSSNRVFSANKKNLVHLIDYLQQGNDHPVIQAGIAYIQLYLLAPFKGGVGRISRLASYLYLYKYGLGFRDLLVIEEHMGNNLATLKEARESVDRFGNLTPWLEYFAYLVGVQADKALKVASEKRFRSDIPSVFFRLNERQRQIISLLDRPGSQISNRQIQKKFGVSQITASRDLSKLANLNLILTQGKGRSRHYVKGLHL